MNVQQQHINAVQAAIDSLSFWMRHGEDCVTKKDLRLLREVNCMLNKLKGGE